MPEMVERMRVEEALALLLLTPSRTTCRASSAAAHLLLSLFHRLLYLIKLIGADQLLLEELLLATVVHLCLLQVDFGKAHTSLGRTELSHIRNHLYLGDNLARLNIITCLLAYLGDDTANLRLHVHLVARLNLTRDHGGFQNISHLWGKLGILHRLRL